MSLPDYATRKHWKELGFTVFPYSKPWRIQNIRVYGQDDIEELDEQYLTDNNDILWDKHLQNSK